MLKKLEQSDFRILYDSTGGIYRQQLLEAPGLTLYGLLDFVFVQLCGFARVKTNISNFAIRRADFSQKEPYLSGVAGHIGAFVPDARDPHHGVHIAQATRAFLDIRLKAIRRVVEAGVAPGLFQLFGPEKGGGIQRCSEAFFKSREQA